MSTKTAYQRIKNWTISDLREYVLNDEVTSDDIAFVRKGLTSEVVAGGGEGLFQRRPDLRRKENAGD
ncbi:ethanolamine ammonia-lyase heavy subunit [Klebsiella oxytoca]|nr:ethanolamine ammonia-lyase heavy subunit [Klebsiella oxytoca]